MVNKSSNKIIFVSIVLVLLAIGVYAYVQQIPNPGQGGDSILVSIDSFTMTLQEAIDYGFLVDGASSPTQSYTLEIPDPGHNASKIYISVDGVEMSLQEAIDSTGLSGSVLSSYNSAIALGHSADEIWVSTGSGEMSLQDAVNSGEFSCVPDCIGKECGDDGCGGSCGTCASNYECQDGVCVDLCTAGSYDIWSGTCTTFCSSKDCSTAQVYGTVGSNLLGCSVCWESISSGPYGGDFNDCAIIQQGVRPICATQCRCS